MEVRQDPLPPLPPIRDAAYPHAFPSPAASLDASSSASVSGSTSVAATTPTPVSKVQRRRTSTTGSRCVAKLTPEQLAKKRQNDREAQKAIRERTKTQIENLERRIRELTEQKPYQELQDVIRQKEAVEAENEDIRRRLASVLSIVQPLCQSNNLTASTTAYVGDAPLTGPIFNSEALPSRQLQSTVPANVGFNGSPVSTRRASSVASTYHPSPQSTRQTLPLTPAAYGPQPLTIPPLTSFDQPRGGFGANINGRTSTDEKLELGYLLQGRNNSTGSSQTYSSERTPSVSSMVNQPLHTLSPFPDESRPAYSIPTKTLNMCPLDGLMLKFLADQRQKAMDGIPMSELIGPPYPHFRSLIDPRASESSHPLSRVFTDILDKFPDISTLPEQVAVLYIMFLIMRWQICPTQETYDALPDWVTPRPSQLFTPHPAWVDHIPWPRMRDKMVRIYTSVPIEDYFIPYTTTISLNWPRDPNEVLLLRLPNSQVSGSAPMTSPSQSQAMDIDVGFNGTRVVRNWRGFDADGEVILNPAFERHLRDLANWTLGPAFAKAHPSLADTFPMK